MLAELRRLHPACSAILADAHALPLRTASVDLDAFVTTLEFLADPRAALAEAARVARRCVLSVALNRSSVGAMSRRIGPESRGALLAAAHDLSLPDLRGMLEAAASTRVVRLRWRSALLPAPLPARPTHLPLGDVVGVAMALRREEGGD